MVRRTRIRVAFIVWLLTLSTSLAYRLVDPHAINDLFFPVCGAAALLSGIDPYSGICKIVYEGVVYPPNPMTTIFVAIPFTFFDGLAHLMLWSTTNAVLAYALVRDGQWWKLLTFLSLPYWQAFLTLQWSPLFTAVALLPSLLPLALVKPQLGLPILLTNLTPRRAIACALFALATLIPDHLWLFKWWPQAQTYDGVIPLLALPLGPLLLLALIRYRDRRALFLFFMAAVPQRGYYDLLPLWTLYDTPRKMLIITAITWAAYALTTWLRTLVAIPHAYVLVIAFYIPSLLLVLQPAPSKLTEQVVSPS